MQAVEYRFQLNELQAKATRLAKTIVDSQAELDKTLDAMSTLKVDMIKANINITH